jgi:DNA-binding FrmR family transcriptional regulator
MPRSSLQPKTPTVASPARESDPTTHSTHKDVINRLKRADGHLQTIIAMIENGRGCLDIAQQMHAVIRALEGAQATLIHDHIEHCLEAAIGPSTRADRAAIKEFKQITKYL